MRALGVNSLIVSLVLLFGWSHVWALGTAQQNKRLVLAFYYGWFDDNTWSPQQVPDMPPQPYRSRDRSTIERQVTQAQQAGIDAFVMSWYGPREENNQTETNFRTLLEVSQERGFRATVDFEITSPFYSNQADVVAALRYLLATHAQHPAFLRYEGKPVIFFWRQQVYDVSTWVALRQQIDPEHTTVWIAEGVDVVYQDVFDGHHLYNVTWNPPTDPAYTATKFRRRIDQYNTAHGTQKLWVATVMPGLDDTHIAGRSGTYIWPRRNGVYYRQTWEAAAASYPEMIIVNSFNEWREGTMIEPSVTYGDLYLNLTHELSTAYRQGTIRPKPTVIPTSVPLARPSVTPTRPYLRNPLAAGRQRVEDPGMEAEVGPIEISMHIATPIVDRVILPARFSYRWQDTGVTECLRRRVSLSSEQPGLGTEGIDDSQWLSLALIQSCLSRRQ